MALQHLRSNTANKRPDPTAMADGQLAINTPAVSPGLFFKDAAGVLVKVGPVHVGTTAPNASPASGGTAGNSVGEQWLDTTGGTYVFKVWDGSAWRSESGTFVDASGDTMTGALGIIAGSAAAPGLYFSGDTNTGIYSPGADQLAISTGGSGRLFINASGSVSVGTNGTSSATEALCINGFAGFGDRALTNPFVLLGNTGSGAGVLGTYSNHALEFRTNNSERLRITSAGLVGVGTSSPGHVLDVVGNINAPDTNGTRIGFKVGDTFTASTTAAHYGLTFGAAGSNTVGLSGYNGVGFYTVGTERVRITPAGNVGIGTTSPGAVLHTVVADNAYSLLAAGATGMVRVVGYSSGIGPGGLIESANAAQSAYLPLTINGTDVRLASGGNERARIDSSGRFLVGTSTSIPTFGVSPQFEVAGGEAYQANLAYRADAFAPYVSIGHSRSASVGTHTILQNGDDFGTLGFVGSDGSSFVRGATISAQVDGTPGANDMPGRLVFSVTADGASSPTERMRIQSTGKTTFFAASGQNVLGVHTASAAGTTDYAFYVASSATSTTAFSATNLGIFTNGNVVNTNNSYGAISDVKLKENIVDANSQWDDLKSLQVRNYNFKEGQTHTQIGLVAQEVELVSPGLVSESPDRDAEGNDLGTVTKSVNYSVLYMKAVKALQEAMERIEQLETSNADLLARVTALEAQ